MQYSFGKFDKVEIDTKSARREKGEEIKGFSVLCAFLEFEYVKISDERLHVPAKLSSIDV